MNTIFGLLCLYGAYVHYPYYKNPAAVSREKIKMMALIIMIFSGGYGAFILYGVLRGAGA